MYLVVSRWEPLDGTGEAFETAAAQVSDKLRMQPGVMLVEGFRREARFVAVALFRDEEAFERIARDADSPFAYILHEAGLEKLGRLVSSEHGPAIDHD